MPLLTMIVVLILIGIILRLAPMDAAMKNLIFKVISVVVIVLLAIWLLGVLGLWHPGGGPAIHTAP